MKLIAKIQNKSIIFERLGIAEDFLSKMDGKRVLITIENLPRSGAQNRMLWGLVYDSIVLAIQKETGQDADDIHDYYKTKFLRRRLTNGQVVVGSTARLNSKEFSEFVEQVKASASVEFLVTVPETFEVESLIQSGL